MVKVGSWAAGIAAFVVLLMALGIAFLRPARLPVPPPSDVVIAGVTVLDPGVGRRADQTIRIRAGRIAEVRPHDPGTDPEPMCPGCYAVPGLIDAHVHTPPSLAVGNQALFSLLYLAHGVTTVRDLGASDDSVAALAERLNRGEQVGPQMLRCGPVLDGDPPGWPLATVIRDRESGAETVDRLAAEGVDCIKVYNEISAEAYEGIASAARRHGLPMVGHVPHAVGLEGVHDFEAQHLTGVPYLSLPRPPIGWDIRDEDVLMVSDHEVDRALDVAVRREIRFTPTLANFSLRLTASDRQRFPPSPAAALLPAFWVGAWNVLVGHPTGDVEIERRQRARLAMRALVRRAHERGIDILAGTDTIMPWVVPGESLHLELRELERAMDSAEAALAAATTVNGRHLASGEIGEIAPGARADLLLLPNDPTQDLTALREWRVLFTHGRRYDRATIDGWLEGYRRHFRGGFYERVMGGIVAGAIGRFEQGS